jgi:tRNA (guanine-N(7)-)-methyltransferase subunit TRM82
MTRRPCAISVTADDSTILCADKFGDVYALPLIPDPEEERKEATPEVNEAVTEPVYVPSATVLTVHSGRNRKVLEEQLKQSKKAPKKPKEGPSFKHELLLGHVSMLTDILYAKIEGRSYIITADRDEHIRVSRGPPQSHIIEGFCHGHEAFVSRLCMAGSNRLVSGGGDPYLCVWDRENYRLLEKLEIRDAVLQFMKSQPHLVSTLPANHDNFRTAVTGIWSAPCAGSDVRASSRTVQDEADREQVPEVLVACEGVPALFSFRLGGSSTASQVIASAGNPLDLTFICPSQGACTAVVSIDNVHAPGSTTEIRKDEVSDLTARYGITSIV